MRKALRWVVAVALLAVLGCERVEGPAPVAWDRTRCDRCSMLISEPAFAAQLHAADGSVLHYDDPGCLFVALEARRDLGDVTLWLHHHDQDRWLEGASVGFVPTAHSPMGYRLGAVAAAEDPAAISLDRAQARALAHDRSGRPLADGGAP